MINGRSCTANHRKSRPLFWVHLLLLSFVASIQGPSDVLEHFLEVFTARNWIFFAAVRSYPRSRNLHRTVIYLSSFNGEVFNDCNKWLDLCCYWSPSQSLLLWPCLVYPLNLKAFFGRSSAMVALQLPASEASKTLLREPWSARARLLNRSLCLRCHSRQLTLKEPYDNRLWFLHKFPNAEARRFCKKNLRKHNLRRCLHLNTRLMRSPPSLSSRSSPGQTTRIMLTFPFFI